MSENHTEEKFQVLETENPYLKYDEKNVDVIRSMFLEKFTSDLHHSGVVCWVSVSIVISVMGTFLYALVADFNMTYFVYVLGYFFILFLLKPFHRMKSGRIMKRELDIQFSVDDLIEMKRKEPPQDEGFESYIQDYKRRDKFLFKSTCEYLSNKYGEKGKLTVFDVLVARELVKDEIKQLKEAYAKKLEVDKIESFKIEMLTTEQYSLFRFANRRAENICRF